MKIRYRVLIAIATVIAVALTLHFGGRALIDWVTALHA
jgi:hypothetical protein